MSTLSRRSDVGHVDEEGDPITLRRYIDKLMRTGAAGSRARDPDPHAADGILDARVLKVHDHHFFEGIMRPGDVYVEAGAYEGRFLLESGLYDPRCTYHLIEPEAHLTRVLWGSKPNVFIHPFALVAESGDITFYVRKKASMGNTTVRSLAGWLRKKRVVKGVSWKDFFTERVRLLAVNIEGAEYDVLRQVQAVQVDYMSVEFHPGNSGIDTETYLKEVLPDWRTLALTRLGDPYNVWFGRSPDCAE